MQSAAQIQKEIQFAKKARGKRYAASLTVVREKQKLEDVGLSAADAFKLLLETKSAKFDESVNASIRLGIDPKQSDQMVRGAITLPHGVGRKSVIVVFAKGDKASEAEAAGADFVGADDLVQKINGGWMDFTSVVATPDMMGVVSKLAKLLGPRGLMPNPKVGTVTFDLTKTIGDLKKGRAEYRTEKGGIVQTIVGKRSYGAEKLVENFEVLIESLLKAKPPAAKGQYLRSIYISSTTSPSVRINPQPYLER